jgi:cytidylate kinase
MRRFDACRYRLEIDLKPALDEQTLDKRIQADFEKHSNSDFINALGELLSKKLIPVIVARSGIDARCKVHSVTHAQRQTLLRLLKAFPLEVTGTRPIDEAIVTSGGVDLRQVDPKTMGSKLVEGLYFAGEVLDLDAYTGGYDLQIAWSTAHAAACAIAEYVTGENDMQKKETVSIAIDGPAGAGKSTLAKQTAAAFGFIYVDTGAIYRTVGLAAKRAGVGSKDADGVSALLPGLQIELRHNANGEQRMYLAGEDVSEQIRTPEISIYASDVSAMPPVRAFLLEMQRKLAREHSVVMDGRDIGTVVLPDAGLKILLTASAEARAKRRLLELQAKGVETSFEEVLRDIRYREENDSSRAAAPLRAAEDSVLLDTTDLTLEESREKLLALVKERFSL